jgi:DNA-binding MarR family transcriptional regulator
MGRKTAAPGPRYEATLKLLEASEALWNARRIFLEQWNLSPSQFNVLNLLFGRKDGCTQAELSRRLIMHRSNVTGLVDRLEARGLVHRRDSQTDRRAFNVAIAAQGATLMRQIYPRYYKAAEAIWGNKPVAYVRRLATDVGLVSLTAGRVAAAAASSSIHRPHKAKA